MATPIVGSSPAPGVDVAPIGGAVDGVLPLTGFGPGTLIVALIGGILTFAGAVLRRISRRDAVA